MKRKQIPDDKNDRKMMEANYRIRRQYDEEWNKEEVWPEAEFPEAKSRYMKSEKLKKSELMTWRQIFCRRV